MKMSSKSAAKTRNMVLDTHDANMFVTGDKPALPAPRSSRGSQSVEVNSTARRSAASAVARAPPPKYAASLTGLPSEGGVTRKVGEQSNRDWAIMSRFEMEVYARQQAEIKAEEKRAVAAQRRELDQQMSLIERRKQRAKEEKAAMAAAVAADVERFKREEEAKRERQRGADEAVRAEQSAIMAALESRRLEAEAAKRAEEEAALVEITRQLEQERLEKAAKVEKLKKDAAVTMALTVSRTRSRPGRSGRRRMRGSRLSTTPSSRRRSANAPPRSRSSTPKSPRARARLARRPPRRGRRRKRRNATGTSGSNARRTPRRRRRTRSPRRSDARRRPRSWRCSSCSSR